MFINLRKKTLILVAIICLSIVALAVPANKKPVTIKQPNGKTLTFVLAGDEHLNWANTLDGYTLLHSKSGEWVYATRDETGNMVPSSVLAANEEERSENEIAFLRGIEKNMFFSESQIERNKEIRRKSSFASTMIGSTDIPTIASDSLLVILVNYSDKTFQYTQQDFQNMFAQPNYNGTGSLKDYYYSQSGGLYDMKIRVVGPYTLSQPSSYYAQSNGGGKYLVRDAVIAADNDVDYSHFANIHTTNGDKVGCVFIMYAGTPKSSTGNADEVWPHQGEPSTSLMRDGVRFSHYVCGSEKASANAMTSIGTMCHEFGHALGLPDHYDTYNNGNGASSNVVSTGKYDLMCEGCYNNEQRTPANWSAFEKLYTGWLGCMDTLTTSRDSILVPTIKGANDTAYLVKIAGTQEFFTIEARRKTGWDAYIPAAGLLVHHGNMSKINAWINSSANIVNVDSTNRGWFIEPSDGVTDNGDSYRAPFASSSNIHYFTNASNNRISTANGTPITGIAFTDMNKINDSLYTFNFNSDIPMLETSNASGVTMYSFNTSGKILYPGRESFTHKGIVYSTEEDCPFVEANAIYDNNLTDTVNITSLTISNLERGERYYFRSFIKNSLGTHLGPIKNVSTISGLGSVAVQSATNIDTTSATLRANMTSIGLEAFVAKGFVYTTDADISPDLENSTVISFDNASTGMYTYDLTGLESGHTYYVRAFVTNGYGTAYSSRISFTTLYPAINNNVITATTPQVCQGIQPGLIEGGEPTGGFGNFTYLWQVKNGNSWEDADATTSTGNNQKDYQPALLTDSTQFRRVVYSDGIVSNTSNSVLIDVRISRGGNLTFAYDTVVKNTNGTLQLSSYRGTIVDWEKSSDDGNTYTSLGNTAATLSETFSTLGSFDYRVKVQIDACPEAYSNVKRITVIPDASINCVENNFHFAIMPNPATNGTFAISSQINNAQQVIITNILGQVVYMEENTDLNNKIFSLPNIDNGTYTVIIKADNKIAKEKLIINK